MSRHRTPTLHCDGQDGECGAWDVDYYAATASTFGGVKITAAARAPGWETTEDGDLCPTCSGDPKETRE